MSNGCTSVGKYDPATGLMSFELALDAMKRGRKVTRKNYCAITYWEITDGQLTFGHSRVPTTIDAVDLLAEDWIEVL